VTVAAGCTSGSELNKCGALKLLVSMIQGDTVTELAAGHCLLALANMASHGGLASDIIQLNAVNSLVALLIKAQSVYTPLSNEFTCTVAPLGDLLYNLLSIG